MVSCMFRHFHSYTTQLLFKSVIIKINTNSKTTGLPLQDSHPCPQLLVVSLYQKKFQPGKQQKCLILVPYTEVSKCNTHKEFCGKSKSCTHRNNLPRKCTAVPSCYSTFIAADSIRILEKRIRHCPD